MRTIGVVTVARSDYGILRPVLARMEADGRLAPELYVGGAHLAAEHGGTIAEIEQDGHPIAARVELLGTDDPLEVAEAIGRGVAGFAAAFARRSPDVVLLLGDRFEMLSAAVAALPLRIPVAHLHGGESSEGAFDESIRHAITKLAHVHFASAEPHARRLLQLGEEPWRVHVTGAPALDAIASLEPLADAELESRIGMSIDGGPLVVTYHPATLDDAPPERRVDALLEALAGAGRPVVLTYPNADPGSTVVRERIERFAQGRDDVRVVPSLGSRAYFSLLRRAAALVGNSSSGILEAASFGLPVVNVGDRQEGRLRAANVIDVGDDEDAIRAGIDRALSEEFRSSLATLENPYGDGHAAERIVEALATVELGPRLLKKRFHDLDG